MQLIQSVNLRRLSAAAALTAALLCGNARAQVLEQVPSDAMAVVKIKNLAELNTKTAKMAKSFGLDELQPELKEPLDSALKEAKMTKGINKSGDAALVLFAPAKGEKDEPVAVAIVPVSDYDEFVSNFKKAEGADGGGDITAVKDPHGGDTMYLAHRGKYAVMSDKKSHLAAKTGGIKLSAAAAREADTRDAVFFFNMPAIRDRALPELKSHRKEWLAAIHKDVAKEGEFKQFGPVIETVFNQSLDLAQNFLQDSQSILFSMNLSDEGLSGGGLVEFAPTSNYGMTVASLKAGNTPLLAGLPDRKYFMFGGSSVDQTVLSKKTDEFLNPIVKDLRATDNEIAKKIADLIDAGKTELGSANHSVAGWIVSTKPLGQESIFQQVSVSYGDAKAMNDAQKKMVVGFNDLLSLNPQNAAKTKIEFGETKSVGGVDLQVYSTKLEMDPNNPQAAQAKQILDLMYGPSGMTGAFGVVNPKTFIVAQGVSDDVMKEFIDAAKSEKDVLSESAGVKTVAAQLPRGSSVVYYVALDNIVSSSVKYAQGFGLPIKMKLPHDLPPVGISIGAEGSALRFDTFIPTQTVQTLIAAGIQAYTQMQGGPGGGL